VYKVKNNPNCLQLEDSEHDQITTADINRLLNSQFRIIWQFKCYVIRDIKNKITVVMGFKRWMDAFIFLKEKAKVI
jgi:hypothetical protein